MLYSPDVAFEQVDDAELGRLAQRVRLYGLRHLRDAAAAEDLAQQVSLIVLESLRDGRLREPEKLASFALGTARMVAMDIKRGAQRRTGLLETYGRGLAAEPWRAPALDRERLKRCLEKLPERERSVVVLTFYDERTSAEVAEFAGMTDGNVRVVRHRALRRLRECMSGADQ
jgi:RNA polymerase sigma-70 factor (ECF subfamily)